MAQKIGQNNSKFSDATKNKKFIDTYIDCKITTDKECETNLHDGTVKSERTLLSYEIINRDAARAARAAKVAKNIEENNKKKRKIDDEMLELNRNIEQGLEKISELQDENKRRKAIVNIEQLLNILLNKLITAFGENDQELTRLKQKISDELTSKYSSYQKNIEDAKLYLTEINEASSKLATKLIVTTGEMEKITHNVNRIYQIFQVESYDESILELEYNISELKELLYLYINERDKLSGMYAKLYTTSKDDKAREQFNAKISKINIDAFTKLKSDFDVIEQKYKALRGERDVVVSNLKLAQEQYNNLNNTVAARAATVSSSILGSFPPIRRSGSMASQRVSSPTALVSSSFTGALPSSPSQSSASASLASGPFPQSRSSPQLAAATALFGQTPVSTASKQKYLKYKAKYMALKQSIQ